MGLCLADSLLSTWRNHGDGTDFDGSDVRARFHAWWYHGLNNAFAEDDRRGIKVSVGLGGNVSMSLRCLKPGVMPPPVFERDTDDAGNGSLMRLAPVPVRFWANPRKAREIAALQSYSTHPGPIAACCCEFLAFATARAIAAPDGLVGGDGGVHVVEWLDATVAAFVADIDAEGLSGPGWDELRRLLASQEPPDSLERNWNWRARSLDICNTLARRGRTYNGHPVIPEYYGAFSMDGLALALFCVHHTKSFDDAVERCVNFLGDADSTGSMVGQLAGAIYGMDAIDHRLVEKMLLWDSKAIIPLRAAMLFATGTSHDES
jgi:ADP-ribosyl-[dinitrogen reductase] hydrolase